MLDTLEREQDPVYRSETAADTASPLLSDIITCWITLYNYLLDNLVYIQIKHWTKTSLDGSSTARRIENGSKCGRNGEEKSSMDSYSIRAILQVHVQMIS